MKKTITKYNLMTDKLTQDINNLIIDLQSLKNQIEAGFYLEDAKDFDLGSQGVERLVKIHKDSAFSGMTETSILYEEQLNEKYGDYLAFTLNYRLIKKHNEVVVCIKRSFDEQDK